MRPKICVGEVARKHGKVVVDDPPWSNARDATMDAACLNYGRRDAEPVRDGLRDGSKESEHGAELAQNRTRQKCMS